MLNDEEKLYWEQMLDTVNEFEEEAVDNCMSIQSEATPLGIGDVDWPVKEEMLSQLSVSGNISDLAAKWAERFGQMVGEDPAMYASADHATRYEMCSKLYGPTKCRQDFLPEVQVRIASWRHVLNDMAKCYKDCVDTQVWAFSSLAAGAAASSGDALPQPEHFVMRLMSLYRDPEVQEYVRMDKVGVGEAEAFVLERNDPMTSAVLSPILGQAALGWRITIFTCKWLLRPLRAAVVRSQEVTAEQFKGRRRMLENDEFQFKKLLKAAQVSTSEYKPTKKQKQHKHRVGKAPAGAGEGHDDGDSSEGGSIGSEGKPWDAEEEVEIMPDAVPVVDAPPALPVVRGDKVYDIDNTFLGNYHEFVTETGFTMSVRCAKHGCKRMTTMKKDPSRIGALRWLQRSRAAGLTKKQHNDEYLTYVLPKP